MTPVPDFLGYESANQSVPSRKAPVSEGPTKKERNTIDNAIGSCGMLNSWGQGGRESERQQVELRQQVPNSLPFHSRGVTRVSPFNGGRSAARPRDGQYRASMAGCSPSGLLIWILGEGAKESRSSTETRAEATGPCEFEARAREIQPDIKRESNAHMVQNIR